MSGWVIGVVRDSQESGAVRRVMAVLCWVGLGAVCYGQAGRGRERLGGVRLDAECTGLVRQVPAESGSVGYGAVSNGAIRWGVVGLDTVRQARVMARFAVVVSDLVCSGALWLCLEWFGPKGRYGMECSGRAGSGLVVWAFPRQRPLRYGV